MSTNPFTPPTAPVNDVQTTGEIAYVGFWARTGAALIDTVLLILLTSPMLVSIYGWAYFGEDAKNGLVKGPADFAISWVLPAVVSVWFWLRKQATPGKMAISAKIVDAKTGGALSVGQSIIRYLGYFVALLPLGLGVLWVAFDARKQGWHDKMAGTVVVKR